MFATILIVIVCIVIGLFLVIEVIGLIRDIKKRKDKKKKLNNPTINKQDDNSQKDKEV